MVTWQLFYIFIGILLQSKLSAPPSPLYSSFAEYMFGGLMTKAWFPMKVLL